MRSTQLQFATSLRPAERRSCGPIPSSKIDPSRIDALIDLSRLDWILDDKRAATMLHAHRCHSLVRLLPLPDDVRPLASVKVRETNDYRTVQGREDLQDLEAAVFGSDVCAVDTESDDKDPRKASLLGVAFSEQKGTALLCSAIGARSQRV